MDTRREGPQDSLPRGYATQWIRPEHDPEDTRPGGYGTTEENNVVRSSLGEDDKEQGNHKTRGYHHSTPSEIRRAT